MREQTNEAMNKVRDVGAHVGYFIICFGSLEVAACEWVEKLSPEPMLKTVAAGLRFGQRVELVLKLIKRTKWEPEKKNDALRVWERVLKLADTRNLIAHNPIQTSIRKGQLFVGIVNFKTGLPDSNISSAEDLEGYCKELRGLLEQAQDFEYFAGA